MLTIPGRKTKYCDGVSRRSFLKIGGLGAGEFALPDLLQLEAQAGIRNSHKSVILIYLVGGPPHTLGVADRVLVRELRRRVPNQKRRPGHGAFAPLELRERHSQALVDVLRHVAPR